MNVLRAALSDAARIQLRFLLPVQRSICVHNRALRCPGPSRPYSTEPVSSNPHYHVEEVGLAKIEEKGFRIDWAPNRIGQIRTTRFGWSWLRDNCTCPLCIDPSTRQKLRRTTDIPFNFAPPNPRDVVTWEKDVLTIEWEDHTSTYPLEWLHKHSGPKIVSALRKDPPEVKPWVLKDLPDDLFIPYGSSERSRGLAIAYLLKYGIVFFAGVPSDPEAIKDVAHTFGKIRETFYGVTWDVRSVQDSKNIAYTDKDLGFHQDLLYMQRPPQYQILHCLKNQVTGGTSAFVDGFMAGNTLQYRRQQAFNTLVRWHMPFQYVNDGHGYYASHPTFELGTEDKQIIAVNYSPPFQGPWPVKWQAPVYNALNRFAHITEHPLLVLRRRMEEGDCVIFNNRRILHARDPFDSQEGERWLKGCYLEEEEVIVNWRKYGVVLDPDHNSGTTSATSEDRARRHEWYSR